MQGAFKTPEGKKAGDGGGEGRGRLGDLSSTNWTELKQSRTRRECFQHGRGPPLSPEHPRLQPHCFGYSVEGRVLNLAKYRATSVTTFAFWGSEDESHIPGFEAF